MKTILITEDLKKIRKLNLTNKDYKSFMKYMQGQTVMLDRRREVFYQWDYDRWKANLPCID